MENSERKPSLKLAKVPELEINLERDAELGKAIADAKIQQMASAFNERYQQGVQSIVHAQGSPEVVGEEYAGALVEVKRRTIVSVGWKTAILSGVAWGGCLLFSVPIVFFPLFLPLALVGGVALSCKR